MTNLNKTREEIIYELVLSLNNGNTSYSNDRVQLAIFQYEDLVKNKIVTEWCEHNWEFENSTYDHKTSLYENKFKCSKCGKTRVETAPF